MKMRLTLLMVPALATAAAGLLGSGDPPRVSAELEDLVSGRSASDESDAVEDGPALSCATEDDLGRVGIRLTAASGTFHWAIRQGEVTVAGGNLTQENGWADTHDDLAPGLYEMVVSRQDDGHFRRHITFATGIDPDDEPDARKLQDALARHRAGDYQGLHRALGPLGKPAAGLPSEMRGELEWSRIDCMRFFRKFDDIFPAIEAFRSAHPGSRHLAAVAECELAARFELGLKKTLESVRFDNPKSGERRAEGREHLGRFRALAARHAGIDYATLPKRSLREDHWTARLILEGDGAEESIRREIAAGDPARLEQFHLHCALMCAEIHPDRPDRNIARMKAFISDHPDSPGRPRVEVEMANVALEEGIRLAYYVGGVSNSNGCSFPRHLAEQQ